MKIKLFSNDSILKNNIFLLKYVLLMIFLVLKNSVEIYNITVLFLNNSNKVAGLSFTLLSSWNKNPVCIKWDIFLVYLKKHLLSMKEKLFQII